MKKGKFSGFNGDERTTSLTEAKRWLKDRLPDGAFCPCCEQLAKVYKRKLGSAMAFVLVLVDRHKGDEWIHIPSYINAQSLKPVWAAAVRGGGDYAKLIHWGLLERAPNQEREDGSDRAGYYKITSAGRKFVRNKIRVPRHIWFYDGEPLNREDDETVSIGEALGDKFDYSELMAAR